MKIVSLLCKLIQFFMVALSVAVHKALILLVFLNHPYQSLALNRVCGLFTLKYRIHLVKGKTNAHLRFARRFHLVKNAEKH